MQEGYWLNPVINPIVPTIPFQDQSWIRPMPCYFPARSNYAHYSSKSIPFLSIFRLQLTFCKFSNSYMLCGYGKYRGDLHQTDMWVGANTFYCSAVFFVSSDSLRCVAWDPGVHIPGTLRHGRLVPTVWPVHDCRDTIPESICVPFFSLSPQELP